VTATFSTVPPITYTLAVHTVGSGTVDPDGGTYISGTVVGINAISDPGWQFGGWTGALVSTTTTISLTMESNKIITATFELLDSGYMVYLPVVNRQ